MKLFRWPGSHSLTYKYGRWLRFEQVYVRPSILVSGPNCHDLFEALSIFPCFCAVKWIVWYYQCHFNFCVYFYLSSITLTWKTNSSELRGMVTCCVSHNAPDIATQTLAVVVTGPYFFDGNITTRYGNSVFFLFKWKDKNYSWLKHKIKILNCILVVG